jgi:HTH-type transcriptional regulator/antitoxin HigA
MVQVNPIKTSEDYQVALERINQLILSNPSLGTAQIDELDVLGTLVSAYEDMHFPIVAPSPVEAVRYLMEEEDLKQKDLAVFFGGKGNLSEFLNKKRNLSLKVIKALHAEFKIPYAVLIGS